MSFRLIAAHLEPGEAAEARAEQAFGLAGAEGAQVTALVFPAETASVEAVTPGWDLAARERETAERIRALAARRGLACEVRLRETFAFGAAEVFADQLRVSDIGVLPLAGRIGAGAQALIGAAVFDSGRPVLLAPPGAALAPKQAVVAWDATAAAVRAAHGALPLLRAAEETLVVTVTDDKEMRPGQSGIALTHLLARHGVKARFAALPRGSSGVLEVLVGAAGDPARGLLVMGAVRHAPLRNLVFGSATRDLLDRGPKLPVLLAA
jgi:nucleotide-binding universal stress UspA family protein